MSRESENPVFSYCNPYLNTLELYLFLTYTPLVLFISLTFMRRTIRVYLKLDSFSSYTTEVDFTFQPLMWWVLRSSSLCGPISNLFKWSIYFNVPLVHRILYTFLNREVFLPCVFVTRDTRHHLVSSLFSVLSLTIFWRSVTISVTWMSIVIWITNLNY